ncbi:hypothetical protein Sar04_13840 [Salinispora arenicola]|uniref:Secreted protein n=1 Tax=Salinispora arenicola TaxID=168697 RepID=A0ABQ4JNV2_SALAC|nr:hypothetical protein Sar04_13840 [Salinispora arenicola]
MVMIATMISWVTTMTSVPTHAPVRRVSIVGCGWPLPSSGGAYAAAAARSASRVRASSNGSGRSQMARTKAAIV